MEMIFSQLLILDQISDSATYDALIPSLLENIGRSRTQTVPTFSAFTKKKSATTGMPTNGVRTASLRRSRTCSMSPPPPSRTDGTLRRGKAISIWIWRPSGTPCPQSTISCMCRMSTASPCFPSLLQENSSGSSVLTILTTAFMTSPPRCCRSSAATWAASTRISKPRRLFPKAAPGSNRSSFPSGARPTWSMPSPRTTAASPAAISRRIPSRRSRESPAVRPAHPASSASGPQSL